MCVDVDVIVRGVSPLQPLEPVTKPVSKLVGNWLSTLKDCILPTRLVNSL